jgi:hypothetical protein
MEGQKEKKLAKIFMANAGIPYVLVVKSSDFYFIFEFMFHFKSRTRSICMADFQI